MTKVIAALGWREARDTRTEQRPERLDLATAGGADEGFELRVAQFDRIEIRAVRREVSQRRAGGGDQPLDALDVMRGEVVGDDDVAGREGWDQALLDVGEKAIAVHWAIDDARRGQPRDTQARDKRARLPPRQRRVIPDAVAAGAPAISTEEIGRDAGFIEKDQTRGIPRRRGELPLVPRRGDVGSVVFGGAYRFF